jgi:hypothetical protein
MKIRPEHVQYFCEGWGNREGLVIERNIAVGSRKKRKAKEEEEKWVGE